MPAGSPIRPGSRSTSPSSSPPCRRSAPPAAPARQAQLVPRGTLRTFEGLLDSALKTLDGQIDAGLVREIWQRALDARWDGEERWFHGDLAQGNILLGDGRLAAVIDFGTCGVGDPACDLAIAWTLLSGDGRRAFRERLRVDEAMWARGRGWALWKAVTTCAYTVGETDETARNARRALAEIFAEYSAG